jgi:hypothetical protein
VLPFRSMPQPMEISKNAVVTVTIDCLFVPWPAIWLVDA